MSWNISLMSCLNPLQLFKGYGLAGFAGRVVIMPFRIVAGKTVNKLASPSASHCTAEDASAILNEYMRVRARLEAMLSPASGTSACWGGDQGMAPAQGIPVGKAVC